MLEEANQILENLNQADFELTEGNGSFKLSRPPGSRFNTFAQSFYSKKTYERVFQQWIIDWREEHAEALSRKHFGLARWRHVSGYGIFVSMMVAHAVSTVLRGVLNVWRATAGG